MRRLASLTDTLFRKFSELIYRKTGIHLKPEKRELLNARLGKRLRACRLESFEAYYDHVINDQSGQELVHLIDNVSTNFTSFFREQNHFDLLTSTILPALLKDGRKKKEIVLWSAACSSGEEPYTLGMVLEEFFLDHPGWTYRILATDISTRILDRAERAIYPMDRVANVPRPLLKNFFQKGEGQSEGYVKVKDSLRRKVSFKRFNLMDDFPWQGVLDIIFCRNVMIYFNKATQQTLIDKFYRCLAPSGFLLIGHSESLASIKHQFKQIANTTYRK